MKKYLGVDIGGTAVKIGIIGEDGSILRKTSCSVDYDGYATPVIDSVIAGIDSFLASENAYIAGLSGIGVSATGNIDFRNGIIAGSAGHIKGWTGTKVKSILETRYGLYTTLLNDAKCAALGEYWLGSARGARNVVVVTVGTSIGGGIIVDSKLLAGSTGYAGEIGFFFLKADEQKSGNDHCGYYEHYASTTALVRSVKTASENGVIVWPAGEPVNGRTIFTHDGEICGLHEIIGGWINDVAAGIVSFVHIFNPERVIIGGGVSGEHDKFIMPLTVKVKDTVMAVYRDGFEIRAAGLGNDAGMAGAVYWNMYGGVK